jgi:hypothetical protein
MQVERIIAPEMDYQYTAYDTVCNLLTKTTEHRNYSYGYRVRSIKRIGGKILGGTVRIAVLFEKILFFPDLVGITLGVVLEKNEFDLNPGINPYLRPAPFPNPVPSPTSTPDDDCRQDDAI